MKARGSSLLEVLIAVTILTLASTAYLEARRNVISLGKRVEAAACLHVLAPQLSRRTLEILGQRGQLPRSSGESAKLLLCPQESFLKIAEDLPEDSVNWIEAHSDSMASGSLYECTASPLQDRLGGSALPLGGLLSVQVREPRFGQQVTLILPMTSLQEAEL